jgi:hypothetical protein
MRLSSVLAAAGLRCHWSSEAKVADRYCFWFGHSFWKARKTNIHNDVRELMVGASGVMWMASSLRARGSRERGSCGL